MTCGLTEMMGETLSSQTVSTKLSRLNEQAREHPERVFTTLHHLIDVDFLREAYHRTRKDAAPGVDQETAETYGANLESNLQELLRRYRDGSYRAPPVKRVWLAKDDGGQRPIGIPAFEDKVLQRAAVMLLEAIYEVDFYDTSFGFRPSRNAHQALQALWRECHRRRPSVIIDADISGFFDTMAHDQICSLVRRRINDGHILRFIGKWLNAGVVEEGSVHYPASGAPQGGVLSPMLSNIYLHYVLDEWYHNEVKPRLTGHCFLVRFADDFVIGCEHEADADRVMAVLPKRFERFGLTIHPDKSRQVPFQRPPRHQSHSEAGTFDFLGFTHYWGRSRKGNWVVKRKTAKQRQRRAMKQLHRECRARMHWPVTEQWKSLRRKLQGMFNYYGITGNYRPIERLYHHAVACWRYWLGRRSRNGAISRSDFDRFLLFYPLPLPRITQRV